MESSIAPPRSRSPTLKASPASGCSTRAASRWPGSSTSSRGTRSGGGTRSGSRRGRGGAVDDRPYAHHVGRPAKRANAGDVAARTAAGGTGRRRGVARLSRRRSRARSGLARPPADREHARGAPSPPRDDSDSTRQPRTGRRSRLTALICWPDGTVSSEQSAPSIDGAFPTPDTTPTGLSANVVCRRSAVPATRASSLPSIAGCAGRASSGSHQRTGWLARFPFEALFDGDGFVGDRYQVQFLPSLRVGADLAQNTASKRSRTRALVVGYAGDDLRWSAKEQEGIRRQLPGRVTVMSPAECTKVSVLKELQGEYDIVHFGCHASYDDSIRSMRLCTSFRIRKTMDSGSRHTS